MEKTEKPLSLWIHEMKTALGRVVLQRKRTNRMCTYIDIGIYFKELSHVMVEASKSKICRAGQQARVANRVQRPPAAIIPSCSEEAGLCL